MREHPDMCYSHDIYNNCTLITWGEGGYYKTDYPEGGYTDDVIDQLNEQLDITPEMRRAMEICSMVAQGNPDLDWEKHYQMVMESQERIQASKKTAVT